jgi:phosphatidylinositol glycan class B
MAHKEERFLFPLAILATSYPVLAFSPARERLLAGFGRVWDWRHSIAAKVIGWSAVAAMLFLAVYPFGIRPHMKMAKYLYRHFPAGLQAYSFDAERFDSYPMYRPKPYRVDILFDRQDLAAALAKGPVYLFSDTPTLPPAAQGVHARLVYSEFLFAQSPNAAARATEIMCGYAALKRSTPIHPPQLAFWTLFRLDPGGPNQATPSPCTPDWTSRR